MTDIVLSRAEAVAFAHAVVQVIAEDHGVDLLHVKGPAFDPSLRSRAPCGGRPTSMRQSVDADVLVRPSHVNKISQALTDHGWRRHFDFEDGSAFEHAATWGNDKIGYLDVHRHFPGIELEPDSAFEILWRHRAHQEIAGIPCDVPSITAQRLIMIIHAARGLRSRDRADIEAAWGAANRADREGIETLAEQLMARVALFAGTGRLEQLADERTYPLWRELTSPEQSLASLWWARVRAEPDLVSSVRKGIHLMLPNPRRMETWLGRPPTRREVAKAYVDQVRLGGRALGSALTRRWRA